MKVLLFHIGTPTPVFETELELIRKHDRAGDTVRVLQCTGNLTSCFWNRRHSEALCAACRSRFRNGWEVLAPSDRVQLRAIPEQSVAPDAIPATFDSVADILRFRHDDARIGYGAASTLVTVFRDHRFDTRKHHREIVLELKTAIAMHEVLKRELQEFQPDLVYFFNGRITTQLPAKLLCERMGIPYASYEVASSRNSYRVLRGSTVHQGISLAEVREVRRAWCAEHRAIGEAFFRGKRDRSQVANIPVYAGHQRGGALPPGFDASRRNIAIFNSTIDEYVAIEDRPNRIYEPDETAGVGRILASFESDERFVFHLRVHPHLREVSGKTSQLLDIRALQARFRNLRVIWPAEVVDSYALLDACEKVLSFGSTMGAEATFWGKPSILGGKAYYENFDCAHVARTHEEVVELLGGDVEPRSAESATMYGYWEMSNGIPFEHFRATGFRNGLATGTFDGVRLAADRWSALRAEASQIAWKAGLALHDPGLLYRQVGRRLRAIRRRR